MSLPFDLRSIDKATLFSGSDMAPSLRRAGQLTPQKAQHLVVLVHGLWGNPGHLNYLAKTLRDRYSDDELIVLACRRNLGSLTYDGKSPVLFKTCIDKAGKLCYKVGFIEPCHPYCCCDQL